MSTESDTKALADQFMALIGKGSYHDAFELLKPNWPLPAAEIDNLAYQTDSQLKMVAERFGKLIGTEFIQSNRIGKSYVRYIYIQKFSNHATRWMIVFYRPTDEWKINVVVWDDKTHDLFEMSGQAAGATKP